MSSNLINLSSKHEILKISLKSILYAPDAQDLILESNTCVLSLRLVLSSGVFPARNATGFQIIRSRKIPPSVRFSLPGTVFHRDGQSANSTQGPVKQTWVATFLPY
ncbi:MAG: hypothetical protein FJY21_11370 [Bacteroidetes bacterium]|nr:hypothetical protein [Bacteroidota bacterium]